MICSAAIATAAPAADIPYPDALADANVTVTSLANGNADGLLLGNGDLYGLVWERGGELIMRVTKNDIWDARLDTSKDGPLPKVDVVTGEVTGSTGTGPCYKLPYPQPRCAAALRLGAVAPAGALPWNCVRPAPKHGLSPDEDGNGAVMEVAGGAGSSTGYQVTLPGKPAVSSLKFTVNGSPNAEYYVDVFDAVGANIHKSGWTASPNNEKPVTIELGGKAVSRVTLYTRTLDGEKATNQIKGVSLELGERTLPLRFEKPPSLHGDLNIRKAVASITPATGDRTQIRVLVDRNVVLINSAAPVELEPIVAATLPAAKTGETDGIAWLRMDMPGDIDYAGMSYALAVAARGNTKAVSLVTSFDPGKGDVLERAIALARMTIDEQEQTLIAAHEQAWERFWSRSGVALADKDLQRWWYRLLYFAGTVCRPGTAPVALMPPLATDITPWHGDLHHNYNAWQAFWPLPGANQPELTDPWIGYLNKMLPRFKFLARVTYDIDGVCVPIASFMHEPDPAVCESRNKRQVSKNPWGLTIGMLGMTLQSMWERHLCQPDREYLEAWIYPMLKEGAKFYVAFMDRCKRDESGKVRLGPSYSPEHGKMGIYNCPFDTAYVHYTFDAFVLAADELGRDADLAADCRRLKALLPDYPTANNPDGQPVVVDWEGCGYRQIRQHNIEVPASPVFPGNHVNWFSPEPQKELFRRTILDTRQTGNNSHVMFNIAKARLSMPRAVADAKAFYVPRTLPNGFIRMPWAHGTYMQETIGLVGLVNEFLLQSVGPAIRLFPCWPGDGTAEFAGLRAHGGFVVSAKQEAGKVVRAEITSTVGGKLRLLSPWPAIAVNGKPLQPDARGIVTMDTRPGERLIFADRK